MTSKDNTVHIAIKFFSESEPLESIGELLSLDATDSFVKDDKYFVGPNHRRIEKTYKYNFWEYRKIYKGAEWAQSRIEKFIDEILIPRIEAIEKISPKVEKEFFVFQKQYDSNNVGFHFESKSIKILSQLNFELDIDIYTYEGDLKSEKVDI